MAAETTITLPRYLPVSVTAEDIAKGCRGDALECPVALAAMRALRGWLPYAPLHPDAPANWMVANVSLGTITVGALVDSQPPFPLSYRYPPFVGDWIYLYDSRRQTVEPFDFLAELDETDEARLVGLGVRIKEPV